MRVTKISVKELFGNPAFNYEIELKKDPPITIIHGRNGSGKTVIFKMIHGLFNSNYFIFWKYPFREFRVDFDDGQHVSVTRDYDNSNIKDSYPIITYSKNRRQPFKLELDDLLKRLPPPLRREFSTRDFSEMFSVLADEDFEPDIYNPISDRFLRYGGRWYGDEPEWLSDLESRLDIHFVSTNRLLVRKRELDERPYRLKRDHISSAAAIDDNSKDLKRRISGVIFEASTKENTLNRTFPSRVVNSVNAGNKDTWRYETVRPKLDDLKSKGERLVEVGLLEPGEQLQVDKYDDATLGSVLRIYIEDTEKKLDVYQELADKITLFKKIVQEMLNDKKLSITKEGYEIKDNTSRAIPLKELSSGEQHMIVLMYNLLFRDSGQEDELILIDEPEISLHIAWQERFIENLEEISKLSRFDVMIATHSPSIINGRLELTVRIQRDRTRGK